MGDTSVEELYATLNNLLEDICKFLSGDTFQSFSPDDKQIASQLTYRTKKQLEELPKLLPKTNENEEYVDMTKKNRGIIDTIKNGIQDKPDRTTQENSNHKSENVVFRTVCPYIDLSAGVSSKDVKSGHLWIRKRIFLKQKVYVSIKNDWLLIYVNDTASKPCHFFNLKLCKAHAVENSSRSFVLESFKDDSKKNYIFMTKMPDDASEWVKMINRTDINRQNNCNDEEYDIIEPKADVEENIYNEPEMICPRLPLNLNESDLNDTKPPLPPIRGCKLPRSIWRNSRTSVVSYNEVEDQNQDDIQDTIKHNVKNTTEIDPNDLLANNATTLNKNITDRNNFEKNTIINNLNDENVIKIARSSCNIKNYSPSNNMQTFRCQSPVRFELSDGK